MANIKTITMKDGVKVCVPDSLHLISSYVLEEQRDWFEDEIKFIRKIIQVGDNVIDIGANYGVYTLSIAKIVGPNGKIFSFEPASQTANILFNSIQINGFKNIVVEQKGLSDETGFVSLSINTNSELNSIFRDSNHTGPSEIIEITTLDMYMEVFKGREIDFVKIDAEGEESNIIKGGFTFFQTKSPLVMFEIKAGKEVNMDLISQFDLLDYKTYKLVPGLNILAPWIKDDIADGYLLNLFCCKSDRATLLSNRGFLIYDESDLTEPLNKITHEMPFNNKYFLNLPYAAYLIENWQKKSILIDPLLTKSLNLYQISKSANTANEKYQALLLAFYSMRTLCEIDCSNLRLSTLARIAKELGNRVVAVKSLDTLINNIINTKIILISEPFLLPSGTDEINDDKNETTNFIWSSLLICLEKNQYFSSFYSGNTSLRRLETIIATGFFDDEIVRRRDLIIERFSSLP